MIRQQAFIGGGKMLKGGLHCHTTRSDGQLSPADTIRLHKEHGYDFLALTDHRKYNYENFAPEIEMTIVPGMEFDTHSLPVEDGFRVFHSVCIGPEKENGNPYEQDQLFESARVTCQEEYQPYLDQLHADKQLTIYCHPEWSGTPARYFEKLKGNFAMELWNTGCVMDNDMDKDAPYWDELLGQGIRIYGVATDDGHQPHQHCGGWVMVNAENNVSSILSALENGAFYSSCGPEIFDFYVEDGIAYIKCSEVKMIRMHSERHPTQIYRLDGRLDEFAYRSENGALIGAAFNVRDLSYTRISIIDKDGRLAWTNPIWLK